MVGAIWAKGGTKGSWSAVRRRQSVAPPAFPRLGGGVHPSARCVASMNTEWRLAGAMKVKRCIEAPGRHIGAVIVLLVSAIVAIVAIAPRAAAQSATTRALAVRVRDESGVGVPGADVTLIDSAARAIRSAVTDSIGETVLRAPPQRALRLRVQRLGYRLLERKIDVAAGVDTAFVDVVLERTARSLDTIRVTAEQTLRNRVYHIDSTAIAASKRTLFDAWDVITKLRPDIASGRGPCGGVEDIWINGEWIPPELVSRNEVAVARLRASTPSAATPHLNASRNPVAGRAIVVSLLSLIKPEDIAEMTYHDPCSRPMAQMHTDAALFIVLKPGIGFDPGRGTYKVTNPPR
jgi:carboxypeptidase family protein